MEKETDKNKSVYAHGAEQGVMTGIYLTVLSLLLFYSGASALLSGLAVGMVLAMPWLLFVVVRRYYRATGGTTDVTTMWLAGLMATFFGSLICAMADYLWLEFVSPGFIFEQAQAALDTYKSLPDMRNTELVTSLQRAIDGGLLPTPIEFVANMILLTTFAGSITSLIAGFIVNALYKKSDRRGKL